MRGTLCILFFTFIFSGYSQEKSGLLDILVKHQVITRTEADSIQLAQADKTRKALQIAGFVQARYQNFEETGKISGFDIRRARLEFRANLSNNLGVRLQPQIEGASTKLMDAVVEVKLAEYLNISIGQQKFALSLESMLSDTKYEFIDRAQVIEALVSRAKDSISLFAKTNHNGRDIGIQANGSILNLSSRPFLDYWVGLFNGAGINTPDNNNSKDVVARLVFHPIQGLDIGGSFYNGFGFYGTPEPASHSRLRWGAEARYEKNRFMIQGEYLRGKDNTITRSGYYIESGFYLAPREFQVTARYDHYEPNILKNNNISTWYTFGLNYNFAPNIRLQAAYTFKDEQAQKISNNYASAQFMVGF